MSLPLCTSAFLIPAYNPGKLLTGVISDLSTALKARNLTNIPIICVDDGCTDDCFESESLPKDSENFFILRHDCNLGKGAALKTGFRWAEARGITQIVTLDADGQHPGEEAVQLLLHPAPASSLVLSVRDMKFSGAPVASQRSNAFSNWVLSMMGGERLLDTQCGLRRYPVKNTLALAAPSNGYAFESDLVLRAARTGIAIVHLSCRVFYPAEEDRVSFFDSMRDPARIVLQVIATTVAIPHHRPLRRWGRRLLSGVAFALMLKWLTS